MANFSFFWKHSNKARNGNSLASNEVGYTKRLVCGVTTSRDSEKRNNKFAVPQTETIVQGCLRETLNGCKCETSFALFFKPRELPDDVAKKLKYRDNPIVTSQAFIRNLEA